MSSSD